MKNNNKTNNNKKNNLLPNKISPPSNLAKAKRRSVENILRKSTVSSSSGKFPQLSNSRMTFAALTELTLLLRINLRKILPGLRSKFTCRGNQEPAKVVMTMVISFTTCKSLQSIVNTCCKICSVEKNGETMKKGFSLEAQEYLEHWTNFTLFLFRIDSELVLHAPVWNVRWLSSTYYDYNDNIDDFHQHVCKLFSSECQNVIFNEDFNIKCECLRF